MRDTTHKGFASPPHQHQYRSRTLAKRSASASASVFCICTLFLLALYYYPIAMTTDQYPAYTHRGHGKGEGKVLDVKNYTVVQGFFKQSDPSFTDGEHDLLDPNESFGLIDTSPERWLNFQKRISMLEEQAGEDVTYKVLYLARHGQGVHNVAEAKYGTPAWNCKWSLLETDGELVWGPDPLLTLFGKEQVTKTANAWKEQIKLHVPLPEVLYTSPLRRAIDTVGITWDGIELPRGCDRRIKENLREMIGLHTCDKRSPRSLLEREYHPSFSEADLLWTPDHQETPPQIALRAKSFLDELFKQDPRVYISITGHGGIIGGLLRAVGHRQAVVETGGLIPIVVRATSNPKEKGEPIEPGPSGTKPTCDSTSTSTSTEVSTSTGTYTKAEEAMSASTATEAVEAVGGNQ